MRYSRYYAKQNKDDSLTVVRLGPAATLAILVKDVFLGALTGGLFVIAAGVQSIHVQEAIIWPLMILFPLLTWVRRRAARKQARH